MTKARGELSLDWADRVRKFGPSSTAFMTISGAKRGLERTISHTSTRVGTSAKVAARKVRGRRVRGMKVLAHMDTARWGNMSTADREGATQCPCGCGMQNVEHAMSECGYMVGHLGGMVGTVDDALCSEPEAAQNKWMAARNMGEEVAAIVGVEARGVSPGALGGVAAGLKLLVRRAETALRTVGKAGESWPMDSLAVWAPEDGGPQLELQVEVVPAGGQQMGAAWQPWSTHVLVWTP